MISPILPSHDADTKRNAPREVHPLATLDRIRECLRYDPETGVMTWRTRPREHFATKRAWTIWNKRYAGAVAGTVGTHGRLQVKIAARTYQVQRLGYAMHLGIALADLPDEIDHKDCDYTNNRFENLRPATKAQNACNRLLQRNSTSGYKGVHWYAQTSRWQAHIQVGGKRHHLGFFDTAEEAYAAYCEAAKRLHGEFARVA